MSEWHPSILLIILATGGLIIWKAVSSAREERRLGLPISPGFKGWLLILAVGQCLAPLRKLAELARYLGQEDLRHAWDLFPGLIAAELALNCLILIIAATTAILMLRRSPRFRACFIVQYVVGVLITPLDIVLVRMAVGDAPAGATTPEEIGRWLGTAFFGLLWVLYVLRSRRVQVTFGREEPAQPAPGRGAPTPPAGSSAPPA